MTKKEAIENHRKLWNWLADETERTQDAGIEKENYFVDWLWADIPANECFCCQYDLENDPHNDCRCCPIYWKNGECHGGGEYTLWCNALDCDERAKYAREIAELPEAEIYFSDKRGEEISLTELEETYESDVIYDMISKGTLTFLRREKKGE